MMNQLKAQFLKKMLSTGRSWVQLIIQNVIPIFFVVMTFIITRSIALSEDLPPLKMTLDSYKKTIAVLEGTNAIAQSYQKLFANIANANRLDVITSPMNQYILERVSNNHLLDVTPYQSIFFSP